ncbi:MAG: hypothetical protein APR53_01785 [Methanoculleus sp. SDB]|nr:MAG: hypothetical protein APR53_01785 [Methanoculleus sp. SDB]
MELLTFVRKILKITKFYSMGLALLAVPFTLMWFFTNNPVFLTVGIGYLIVAYILFVASIGINKYSQILAEDKVKIFAYSAKDIVDRVLIECKLNPLKNKSDKHD